MSIKNKQITCLKLSTLFEMSNSTQKIRVGILGLGGIATNHLEAIKSNSDLFELKAVCDKNENILSEFSSPISTYSEYEEMLLDRAIDLISICTPSGMHSYQSIMAGRKNIHVITEKPMAVKLQDAQDMLKEFQRSKAKLFVVKQNRLNNNIKILKELIDKGILGKIHFVQSNVFWTRPQEYYDKENWRGTKEHDGGALMNQASHYVDLLYWLFGPVESLNAFASTTRDIETEDTGVVNLQFISGALGSMNYTMLTYPKNFEGSITVIAEKGTIKIGGTALQKIERWDLEDNSYDNILEETSDTSNSQKSHGHSEYYKNVAEVLKNESKAICDGEDGIKSLQILEATYESVESSSTIYLNQE